MKQRSATLLRADAGADAPALVRSLNVVLQEIQDRISLLEIRQRFVTLGPQRVRLPINEAVDAASVVEFAVPPGFAPQHVFPLALSLADETGGANISPFAAEFRIENGVVRVTRLTTITPVTNVLLLTLGVLNAP